MKLPQQPNEGFFGPTPPTADEKRMAIQYQRCAVWSNALTTFVTGATIGQAKHARDEVLDGEIDHKSMTNAAIAHADQVLNATVERFPALFKL
jgi:hypothetical protein